MPTPFTSMTPEQMTRYLSQMPADQGGMMEFLRSQYGNIGAISPVSVQGGDQQDPGFYQPYAAQGFAGVSDLRPNQSGGFSGNLTAPFDAQQPGGQYGRYTGNFSGDGSLDPASVSFQPEQRDAGWLDNHFPELAAIAGLAITGGAAGLYGAPGVGGAASGAASLSPELLQTGYLGFSPEAAAATAGSAGSGWIDGPGLDGFDPSAGVGGSSSPQVSLPSSQSGWIDGPGLDALGSTQAGAPISESLMTSTGAGGVSGAGGATGLLDGLGGVKGLAAGVGALAGALGGGPSESTTSRNVPEWAQPYAQDITKRGQDIANTPFQPYTGQRFAGPNDAMRTSWEMANQFAQGGPSAGQQVSQGTFNRLQSGDSPDFGNAAQINNQYIGQTTPGAANQYIGQNQNSNVSGLVGGANPLLSQTTGAIGPLGQMSLDQSTTNVGRNALLGQNNPYLNDAIGYATGDITRNFQNTINPQLDRMARASGSFGNSGVEQARQEAERTMAQQIGRTTSDMRMADYNMQAQLGEGDLGRRTSASLTDAARNLGASKDMQSFNIGTDLARQQANLGYRAGDLNRGISGYEAQQNRLLDAGKFDATNAQNNWNTNLAATSDLGKYNSGLMQTDLARNAGLLSGQQQFNAGQGNFDITGARNDWNSAEGRAAQTMGAYQGYDQANTNRIAMLNTTGNEMNRFAQQQPDFNYQEFMRQQAYPAQQLGAYQGAYNTGVNGQSVQSTPTGGNTTAQALGGAMTGIGLYNMFTQPQQQSTNYQFDPITGRRYA